MNAATSAFRILIRIVFPIELALGLLVWSGNLVGLIPVHELLGFLLVLGPWGLALTAEWASRELVDDATANPEFRDSVQKMLDDADLHVTARPVVHEVAVILQPGEVLS